MKSAALGLMYLILSAINANCHNNQEVIMQMREAMLKASRDALYEQLYRTVDAGDWSSGKSSINKPGFMSLPYGEVESVMNELEEVRSQLKEIEDGE